MRSFALGLLIAALSHLPATASAAPSPAASAVRCPNPGLQPRTTSLHYLRTSTLCLINRVRGHYGLTTLHFSEQLRRSATGHSVDMVSHRFFSHLGFGGSTPDTRIAGAGYLARVNYYAVGENIGGGTAAEGSPLAVFRAWMHSAPHRENILSPAFHDFGVGVARGYPDGGGATAATYTLDLGTRH